MDLNHVEASLCFPTFPRFCGQTFKEAKDKELALACVQAYNDWMVEEWCGDSGGRLIPLCIVPLWDVELAADEIQRNAARGVRAVASPSSRPSSACPRSTPATGIRSSGVRRHRDAVCMHIGSSSQMATTSPDAPPAVEATLSFNNAMASMCDFLFSGVLVRHPRAEARVLRGPDRLDPLRARTRRRRVARASWLGGRHRHVPEPPSTYFFARSTAASSATAPGSRSAPGRRRQHHVRDRLPAHRHDVAGHQEAVRGAAGRTWATRSCTSSPGQRDPDAGPPPRLTDTTHRDGGTECRSTTCGSTSPHVSATGAGGTTTTSSARST